jgi:UDPglucose--hexose-1-phosphate uridylyltransferase
MRRKPCCPYVCLTGGSMPELRKDPIVGRWVIISIERKGLRIFCRLAAEEGVLPVLPWKRIYDAPRSWHSGHRGACQQPGWTLRVMPNKFPALQIYGDLNKRRRHLR